MLSWMILFLRHRQGTSFLLIAILSPEPTIQETRGSGCSGFLIQSDWLERQLKMLNNRYSIVFSTNQNTSKKPAATRASCFLVLTKGNIDSGDEIVLIVNSGHPSVCLSIHPFIYLSLYLSHISFICSHFQWERQAGFMDVNSWFHRHDVIGRRSRLMLVPFKFSSLLYYFLLIISNNYPLCMVGIYRVM